MTEEDFVEHIGDWFRLIDTPVFFNSSVAEFTPLAGPLTNIEEVLFFFNIDAPEGLNSMLVPCQKLGRPTSNDWRVASWMCTALNYAKQRTEDVIEELNLDGDDDSQQKE